jgi:hypothetical protein
MPLVLIALSVAASMAVTPDTGRHSTALNAFCLVGVAFLNAVLFVSPDVYAALAFVVVSGALLTYGVRMAVANRRAGQLP